MARQSDRNRVVPVPPGMTAELYRVAVRHLISTRGRDVSDSTLAIGLYRETPMCFTDRFTWTKSRLSVLLTLFQNKEKPFLDPSIKAEVKKKHISSVEFLASQPT